MKSLIFVSVAFVAGLTLSLSARQAPAFAQAPAGPAARPSVYTSAQAAAGQAAYSANCASCHQPTLVGQNEAPPLAGTNFMTTWGARTPRDLIDYMSATMPPGKPSLAETDYVSITAFILQY